MSDDKIKKGDPEFEDAIEDLREGYVTAHFPNLGGYAYEADLITIREGEDIMDDLVEKIVEIDWPDGAHPRFKLEGEDKWRSVEDSDDFPQPTEDDPEAEEEEEDERGDEEEEEEDEEEGDEDEGEENEKEDEKK